MKIILGSHAIDRTEHARMLVSKLKKQEMEPEYPKQALPIGIAFHQVRYPKSCDDCGQTYWSKDEWGSHLGCRGEIKHTGF